MTESERIKEAFEAAAKAAGWKPETPVLPHYQTRPVAFEAFQMGWKAAKEQA